MFTNAKYLNSLSLTDSNTYPQVKALLLDELGLINFTPLMPPDSLAEINNNVQTRLKLKFELLDLSNAAILYAIAQREGRQIGVGEFTGEAVINALMKHMNFAIQNKREVALEICRSWQNVARTIMENTAHKSTKPAPGLFSRIFGKPASPDAPQALLPIAQFDDWLNKIASCSLQAFLKR